MAEVALQFFGRLRWSEFCLELLYILLIGKLYLLLLGVFDSFDASQKFIFNSDGLRLEYFEKPVTDYAGHAVLYLGQLQRVVFPGFGDFGVQAFVFLLEVG